MLDLVERAAADGVKEFAPFREMTREAARQVITLPSTIGKLKRVRRLHLNLTSLVRIGPEIGDMESLEQCDLYMYTTG